MRKTQSGHTPQVEQQIFKAYRYLFTREKTLRRALRLGAHLQRPFVRNHRITGGPAPLSNWTKSRTLPMVAPKPFMQIWADLNNKR